MDSGWSKISSIRWRFDPPRGAILRDEGAAHCKLWGPSAMCCAKTTVGLPTEMQFRLLSRVGPENHVLDGMRISATWRIRVNRPCAAEVRPLSNYFDHLLKFSLKWRKREEKR